MIDIYTDGSCLGNPGVGGWGALIIKDNKEIILKGGEADTTNNRMEMTAVIEALKWINNKGILKGKISLYSDSSLIIQTIMKGWKRKANLDLWEKFDEVNNKLMDDEIFINWNWIKGHANHAYNEKVDEIAVQESKKIERKNKGKIEMEPKQKNESKDADKYSCTSCKQKTDGVLSFMPDSEMIRVDCLNCGKYIMFAEKTDENLKRAKKRILISKEQLGKVIDIMKNQGKEVSEKELKKIKIWTKDEAEEYINSNQTLF